MPVLVGGSSDGASVNISDCNGVRGQLQRALPWLFWAWHRLELACNDACCSPLNSPPSHMVQIINQQLINTLSRQIQSMLLGLGSCWWVITTLLWKKQGGDFG